MTISMITRFLTHNMTKINFLVTYFLNIFSYNLNII